MTHDYHNPYRNDETIDPYRIGYQPTSYTKRFTRIGTIMGVVIPLSFGVYLICYLNSQPPAPPLPPGMGACGMYGLRIAFELLFSFAIGPPLGALFLAGIGALLGGLVDLTLRLVFVRPFESPGQVTASDQGNGPDE